jgi:hypothetical protein
MTVALNTVFSSSMIDPRYVTPSLVNVMNQSTVFQAMFDKLASKNAVDIQIGFNSGVAMDEADELLAKLRYEKVGENFVKGIV